MIQAGACHGLDEHAIYTMSDTGKSTGLYCRRISWMESCRAAIICPKRKT